MELTKHTMVHLMKYHEGAECQSTTPCDNAVVHREYMPPKLYSPTHTGKLRVDTQPTTAMSTAIAHNVRVNSGLAAFSPKETENTFATEATHMSS